VKLSYLTYLVTFTILQKKLEKRYSVRVSTGLGFMVEIQLAYVLQKNHLMVMVTAHLGEIYEEK
jgi:hypothetical protein